MSVFQDDNDLENNNSVNFQISYLNDLIQLEMLDEKNKEEEEEKRRWFLSVFLSLLLLLE